MFKKSGWISYKI